MYYTTNGTSDNNSINELVNKSKEMFNENISSSPHNGYSYDCCKNCPNNPMNNPYATGICHCALPSMEMVRY
jgi:hypothetical protein